MRTHDNRNPLFARFATAIALFLLLFTGCKSSKKVETVVAGEAKSQQELLKTIEEQAFHFNTLSARLNVELELPGKELGSRVDLKMVKDSAFQLSVQPFLGIEVFRMELTTDSIKILDRLNKQYIAENYENLRGQTPIEFNYYNLQALFVNHLFLPGHRAVTPKLYNRFKVEQAGPTVTIKAKDSMGLLYTFLADGEGKLLSAFATDASEQYALHWSYADFRVAGRQLFPNRMNVEVFAKGASAGNIQLNFSRIQTNTAVNMEFSIPAKYKRITFAQIIKSISNSK